MTPTIEIFDPTTCCSTGDCGAGVDPKHARFEIDLRWFGNHGASVTRYNQAQQPGEFVVRPVVAAMLASGGQDVLPIVLVDGKLRFSGTWPGRADLAARLDIEVPRAATDLPAPVAETCCGPGEASIGGCC